MIHITRRGALLGAGVGLLATRATRAAGYPARPVRIIVPFAPAGPTDIMARVVAAHLGDEMGGSFIVENRAGAGGNIGASVAAHAEPDGYTLLVDSSSIVVNPGLYKKVPYDIHADFAPLVELGASPNIIFTNAQTGIKSIADLIARAKADPNALSYGSAGIGTTPHLSGELLKFKAGIQMTHVPFGGAGPAMQAVLSNTIPLAVVSLPPTLPFLKSGQLIGLGVTGKARWPDLPDVATMVELGFPGFITDTFQALFAPAKTPQPIQDALVAATLKLLANPEVADTLHKGGFEVIAHGPQPFLQRINEELPMWRELIARSGIEPI